MPRFSISRARQYQQQGLYGPAVTHYLGVLKCCPNRRASLEIEFLAVFKEFYAALQMHQRYEDAMDYLITASELYPNSARFITFLANCLFQYGLHEEAALCFMKALSIDSTWPTVHQSLRNLRSYFVDQWHFRMLNDRHRNLAYRGALERCVDRLQAGSTVLDIGCGSGILSILAVQAGAVRVWGCDHSSLMCLLAKRVIRLHECILPSDSITVVEKNSQYLKPGEDIGQPVDLVVTELMDAGFYGESIAPTLLDAKRRLLKPQGRIIPCQAVIYAVLVEAPYIRTCHVLGPKSFSDAVNLRSTIASSFVSVNTAEHGQDEEPYAAEMLRKLKHGFKELSDPVIVDRVNLEDVADLEARVEGEGLANEVQFEVTTDGRLDAIVCWFTTFLDDCFNCGDENQITSSYDVDSAWEQAIFPVLNDHRLHSGAKVSVDVTVKGSWFQCSLKKQQQRQQSVEERIEVPDCASYSSRVVKPLAARDTWLLAMLNDMILANTYRLFFEHIKQGALSVHGVLDMSNNPVISFLAAATLQVPVVARLEPPSVKLYHVIANDSDRMVTDLVTLEIQDKKIQQHKEVDVLVCCPVESTGLLQPKVLEHVAYFRTVMNIKHVIPSLIEVYGLVVASEELAIYTHVVSNQNTLGLRIGQVMNDFRTKIQEDIELSTLKYTPCSAEFKLLSLDLEEDSLSPSMQRLPRFLKQRTKVDVRMIHDAAPNALLFWFALLNPSRSSVSLKTADQLTHFKVAAYVFDQTEVKKNQLLSICVDLSTSTLDFLVL